MPLSVGLGYGPEDDGWNHGRWMGESWIQRVDHDLDAEATAQRVAWSMIDHAARARFDGQTGYGIFEHIFIGRHDPSGFVTKTGRQAHGPSPGSIVPSASIRSSSRASRSSSAGVYFRGLALYGRASPVGI